MTGVPFLHHPTRSHAIAATLARSTTIATLLLAGALTQLPAQRDSIAPLKSPQTAFLLSLGATVIPFAIASANPDGDAGFATLAIFIGPAVGHFYAGQSGRAWTGIGIRGAISVGTVLLANATCNDHGGEEWFCGWEALTLGALALVTSDVIDIVAAPGSARKTNAEHAPKVSMIVTPMRDGAKTRMGVGVRVGF